MELMEGRGARAVMGDTHHTPLANAGGLVARGLGYLENGCFVWQQGQPVTIRAGVIAANRNMPRVAPREERGAGGRAHRLAAVRVGELEARGKQRVDVGRADVRVVGGAARLDGQLRKAHCAKKGGGGGGGEASQGGPPRARARRGLLHVQSSPRINTMLGGAAAAAAAIMRAANIIAIALRGG